MAATGDLSLRRRDVHRAVVVGMGAASSATIYQDTFVGDNASGYARALTAGDTFLGVSRRRVDNSSGSNGDLNVDCESGIQIYASVTGAAITSVGSLVYASDDQTLTTTAGSNSVCGVIAEWNATDEKCWVQLLTLAEIKAMAEPSGG